MTRLVCAVGLCLALAACGGGGGGGTGTVTTTPTPSTNPPATTPPGNPTGVAAGATGVDIVVPGPNNTVNAQFLGVTPLGATSGATASTTGDQIHRGSSATIIMFGTGLSGLMTVKISGPGDIQISNQRTITSQGGDSGIAFDAVVSGTAVLGARTVFLVSGNDMTTFSGGLEVVQ